ncbi:MAG: single-stranded DNA-binding protein [Clostridiales bacterium]|jgi:single-strand DNA-binding protein|nr:single-stranded DNA-binding protein [Clostridiales bacterium]
MLNKVILMGRLTRDPELKYTASNIPVCSFSIAVDRRFVRSGEQRQADFINIVAWRQTAEFVCKYFTKGQMINVCGSLQTRNWDDNNGVRHFATEVIADEVNFCGDKPQGGGNAGGGSSPSNYGDPGPQFNNDGFAPVDTDDDLPF